MSKWRYPGYGNVNVDNTTCKVTAVTSDGSVKSVDCWSPSYPKRLPQLTDKPVSQDEIDNYLSKKIGAGN